MKKLLVLTLCLALCTAPALAAPAAGYSLKLHGNLTTGYDWTYTADLEGVVAIAGEYAIPQTDAMMVGAPGAYDYLVTGLKEGDATVTFTYGRSFEPDSQVAVISYTFHVDAALNVTCLGSEVTTY